MKTQAEYRMSFPWRLTLIGVIVYCALGAVVDYDPMIILVIGWAAVVIGAAAANH